MSKKTVTAIRFGWSIKRPGEATETKTSNWVSLLEGLQPAAKVELPPQNIDPKPALMKPGLSNQLNAGTIVSFYIAGGG